MKDVLPVAAVIVGVILLIVGFLWGNIFPPTAAWSAEQNTQLSDLGTELKGLSFKLTEAQANPQMHGGQNVGELKAKHDKVKKEYDALYAEFESARDRPANTGNSLKWVGIIIAGISAVLMLVNKKDA
jgi:hypothetical protein